MPALRVEPAPPPPREAGRPPAARLLSAEMALLVVVGALGMTSLNLALPILPLTLERMTHDAAATGVVTAVVSLFTIFLELHTAQLLRRFSYRWLLAAGLLAQLVAMVGFAVLPNLGAMLACGALAGAGFGLAATVAAAAIGSLAPPGRHGEAIAYYGLAASAPTILAPPLALLLLNVLGTGAVFGAGALVCAVGTLVAARLRGAPAPAAPAPEPAPARVPDAGLLATLADRGVLAVWLAMVCTTVTYGAAVSFTPLLLGTSGPGSAPAFLLVFGIARAVTRVVSGREMDRVGDRRLVLPSLAVGAGALALLTFDVPALTILSGALYGAAFGVVQTGTYVGLLRVAGPGRLASVTGIWNVAVDTGVGTGALVMAPVAAVIGFTRMFWLLPALFAFGFGLRLPGGEARR